MFQTLIVIIAFVVAIVYVVRLALKSFQSKSVCSSGCGKCGAVDFEKLEKQLKERGI